MTGAGYGVDAVHGGRWRVEATPDGCRARVVDAVAGGVAAVFYGETAHSDADRWALDAALTDRFGR